VKKLLELSKIKDDGDFQEEYLCEIKHSEELKSNVQLAYWYSEVLFKLRLALGISGYRVSETQADQMAKGWWLTEFVTNRVTGEMEKIIKSKASATKSEMSHLIESAIQFCAEQGIVVEDAENYKKRKAK
jgi:hypothetical protein